MSPFFTSFTYISCMHGRVFVHEAHQTQQQVYMSLMTFMDAKEVCRSTVFAARKGIMETGSLQCFSPTLLSYKVYGSFPESHFPRKIVCHCFNVKQTLTVYCVNWRIILLTGLLSLIREVMQRGPALLIFTLVSAQRPSTCSPCRPYLLTVSNVK